MDIVSLILVAVRGAALASSLTGDTKISGQLYKLADLYAAGLATDAHMREVAEKLKARNANDADFSDVLSRIEAERTKLHSDKPPTG